MSAGVAATSLWVVDELRSATGSSLSLLTPPYTFPDLQGRRIFELRALWSFVAVTSVRGVMTVTPHHHIPALHLAEKSVLLRYKLPPPGAPDTATHALSIALPCRAIHTCLCTQLYNAVNIAWGGGFEPPHYHKGGTLCLLFYENTQLLPCVFSFYRKELCLLPLFYGSVLIASPLYFCITQ